MGKHDKRSGMTVRKKAALYKKEILAACGGRHRGRHDGEKKMSFGKKAVLISAALLVVAVGVFGIGYGFSFDNLAKGVGQESADSSAAMGSEALSASEEKPQETEKSAGQRDVGQKEEPQTSNAAKDDAEADPNGDADAKSGEMTLGLASAGGNTEETTAFKKGTAGEAKPLEEYVLKNEMQQKFKEAIEPEAKSAKVKTVQERLMELGYMEEKKATEYYGASTQYAINLFQWLNGLDISDTATYETLQALFDTNAKKYEVSPGMEGEYITDIQMRLDALGYENDANGVYDETTKTIVAEFQTLNELDSRSGKIDADSREMLFSEYATCRNGSLIGHTYIDVDSHNERVNKLLEVAFAQLGKPYVGGHKGPNSFDCSGFVYYCLNESGYSIRYQTSYYWRQSKYEYIESMDDLIPGDICTFVGHVGIYIGNGRMIDASSSQGKIRITSDIRRASYWKRCWDGGRRVL